MNGDEVLAVLREIRDEAKITNTRLESLEGRVEFLERRTSKGFEAVTETLNRHVERIEDIAHQQAESEQRLASEIDSVTHIMRQVRILLEQKLDDHHLVLDHEKRIALLENRST